MKRFSDVVTSPTNSPAIRTIRVWLEKRICGVAASQVVVHDPWSGSGRKDEFGRPTTQLMFDRRARPAHVCPFVADSLDRDLCWLDEFDLVTANDIMNLQRAKIGEFYNADPAFDPVANGKAAPYPYLWKTFVMIFPRIKHTSAPLPLFDAIHATLKTEYMNAGLMLGQFYGGCPQPGIHSVKFRPLVSPFPMFVIRYMAFHDHLFFDPANKAHADAYRKFVP